MLTTSIQFYAELIIFKSYQHLNFYLYKNVYCLWIWKYFRIQTYAVSTNFVETVLSVILKNPLVSRSAAVQNI